MKIMAVVFAFLGAAILIKVAVYLQWLIEYWSGFGYTSREMVSKIGIIVRNGNPPYALIHLVAAPIGMLLLVFAMTLYLAGRHLPGERSTSTAFAR